MNNNLIKKIYYFIKTYILKIKPNIIGGTEVTKNELKYIIKQKLNPRNVYISDSKTKLLELDSVNRFLTKSTIDLYKYQKEIFDCDDFSFVLMGQARRNLIGGAFGIVWTYSHALNCFVDVNHNIWIVEPQTDKLTLAENYSKKIYLVII